MKKLNQSGFHLVEVLVVIVVLGVIGLVGWKVLGSKDSDNSRQSSSEGVAVEQDDSNVTWMWGGDKWLPQNGNTTLSEAPACTGTPQFKMPVDISKITKVLYPGQQRSTGYKTHGGFLFENTTNNSKNLPFMEYVS